MPRDATHSVGAPFGELIVNARRCYLLRKRSRCFSYTCQELLPAVRALPLVARSSQSLVICSNLGSDWHNAHGLTLHS